VLLSSFSRFGFSTFLRADLSRRISDLRLGICACDDSFYGILSEKYTICISNIMISFMSDIFTICFLRIKQNAEWSRCDDFV
jgi:hypothetical protein